MSLISPILLSLRVAVLATALTLLVGLGLARLFASRAIPFRRVWESIILLPMVFPPTITGYLLLVFLGKRSPLGALLSQLGLSVVFTWAAAVIASFVVSLPLMFQNCKAALRSVDSQLQNAARTLGLGESRVFLRITLPLATPGILSGTALSFARALGEFGATLMVAGNIPGRTQTIPLALYAAVESGRSVEANILLAVTVALSFGLVAVVSIYERRGGGHDRRSAESMVQPRL
jgi:molybdate transport system permease protein